MDIQMIRDAIEELENEDVTYDNINELASLYIVYNNLQRSGYSMITSVESEARDILPYYIKYQDIKRRYQTNQTTEGEVIQGIKKVCKELSEFIDALYSGTDMNKERLCIKDMIKQLNEKYSK